MKTTVLRRGHRRDEFDCGVAVLNHYLRYQAGQDMRKRLAVCFVLADEAMQVMAYYTLSAQSLGSSAVPVKFRDQLPANYDAPVILLGRLACDLQEQGKGLGSWLLLDALFRSWELSNHSIGAMAVVTDPLDEKATAFYHRYGFYHLEQSARMFLPMKAIQRLFA